MKISCPVCGTLYTVADQEIQSRNRHLQCSQCKHTWHYVNHDSLNPKLVKDDNNHPSEHRPLQKKTKKKINKWIILLIIFLVNFLLGSLYFARQEIIKCFPCTYQIYKKLHIAIDPPLVSDENPYTQPPQSNLSENQIIANARFIDHSALQQPTYRV